MTDKIPLAIFQEKNGKTEKVIIGECEISEDGTILGTVTNDANEHTFKAIMDEGGTFTADLGTALPKYIMRQRDGDGIPK
jgi:hypothetical protein